MGIYKKQPGTLCTESGCLGRLTYATIANATADFVRGPEIRQLSAGGFDCFSANAKSLGEVYIITSDCAYQQQVLCFRPNN